jgi:DNA-binding FadR family transcriptional regulator
VAPGPSDPSPALTMAGATKKITTANPSDDEVKTERLVSHHRAISSAITMRDKLEARTSSLMRCDNCAP